MTEAYDPLKDPTSDGYAKVDQTLKAQAEAAGIPTQTVAVDSISRQAWINGQTDIALFDNPTFKKWGKRILWVVLAAVGFWVGSEMIAAYQAYSTRIEAIEKPQAAESKQPAPPAKIACKTATKKVADKASNTPATAEFVPEVVITVNEQSTVVIKPEVMRTWGEHPVPPLPPAPLN